MGWVSIFDPVELATLLGIPTGAKPVAIICLGHVSSFYKEPMLVESGWKQAKPLADMVMDNYWDNTR